MSRHPVWRAGLRLAVFGLLIAPSVAGAIALFAADPDSSLVLLIGAPTLGAAVALWFARGGWLIAAGALGFLVAAWGSFLSFAVGLGWADGGCPARPCQWDAINLALLCFLVAMPAAIVLAASRFWRSVPATPVEKLPPGWGSKPHED